MFIIHIAAFLILLLYIAWKYQKQIVEVFPVGCALLVLLFYILAFFRALSVSDYLAAAGLVFTVIYLIKVQTGKRKEIIRFAAQELLSPGALTALAMTVIVIMCVSGKAVSWWDDYNFWATDAKSLFYLDGFARKYVNVAAEFGDYPPGTQMMKWWFLHFSPDKFKEGLMFAGYYFMNLAFLFPMLKIIKKRNIVQMALGAFVLWLFPAVAEEFWCDGCCADLTMALVYGAFLTSVVDRGGDSRFFYYGRQALFLMILVLCKNTGFLWVAFGLFFDYGYHMLLHRRECSDKAEKKADRRALFLVTLLPVFLEVSWLLFCLINRRVAKLTGAAIRMATGGMNIPAYQQEMVKAFVEAFLTWPLHRGKTVSIDLTPLSLYLLFLIFVFVLYRFRVLDKGKARYVGGFLAVTGIIFYAVNLLSHLTIFAVETQYLEPFGMISSIERYGAPFTIGGLYLLAFYAMRGRRPAVGALFCVGFVLLTTDYVSAYRGLSGYRGTVDEVMAERGKIVDEAAERFLETVGAGEKDSIGRVLYLRDISDVSWVRNTYIGFEAAPVSVMYGNIDTKVVSSQDIVKAIEDAHAGFIYIDELAENTQDFQKEVFRPFMGEEEFEYGCLYQVVEEAGEIHLVRMENN